MEETTAIMEISVIGVPMDLGADRRGVDMGPSAIRYSDIGDKLRALGFEVSDLETLHVPDPEVRAVGDPRLKYLEPIVRAADELAQLVQAHIKAGALPIILGGDHSIALGSVSGVANAHGALGVIWFDAHGDFNTAETSPSGNIHGMILGALCGYGDPRLVNVAGGGPHLSPQRVAIVGARDLDAPEKELLRAAGVHVLTMTDIDRQGMGAVTQEAIAFVSEGTNGFHVSFDLDVVDPAEAPGVGTPVPGGITPREAHLALEMVAETGRMTSLDLVEVNPILDRENQTALLAAELALSAVGKRIF